MPVKNMMKQECEWMKSQHLPVTMNNEETDESQYSRESFTESCTTEAGSSQFSCQPSVQS